MRPTDKTAKLYPVILSVPQKDRQLKGKDKVACLSRLARQALAISAEKSGVHLKELSKAPNGAPLPSDNHYWSLTHKSTYVGGVVATTSIGIDIEKIRPINPAIFKKTADEDEWALTDADPVQLFFRYWTSKEAVLKATAIGLKNLSHCRIIQVVDARNLMIRYQDENWPVEHFFFKNHIASIVKTVPEIDWTIVENDRPGELKKKSKLIIEIDHESQPSDNRGE